MPPNTPPSFISGLQGYVNPLIKARVNQKKAHNQKVAEAEFQLREKKRLAALAAVPEPATISEPPTISAPATISGPVTGRKLTYTRSNFKNGILPPKPLGSKPVAGGRRRTRHKRSRKHKKTHRRRHSK